MLRSGFLYFSGTWETGSVSCTKKTRGTVETEIQDSALIEQVLAGDRHAFDMIVTRYWERVYGLVRSIVKSHEDALEGTQDSFVRAYRGLSSYRGDCPFRFWLLRIAGNTARNRLRSSIRRGRHETVQSQLGIIGAQEEAPTIERVDPAARPDEQAIANDELSNVEAAMMELRPEAREVLYLKHLCGCSCEEIATVQECSVGTVKSRLFRAREHLMEVMRQRSGEEVRDA
jgi:RNA polymerase sigma-70 factor (ECF subfamily)